MGGGSGRRPDPLLRFRHRSPAVGETGLEPAPKEQPPRNLSGKRTVVGAVALESGCIDIPPMGKARTTRV